MEITPAAEKILHALLEKAAAAAHGKWKAGRFGLITQIPTTNRGDIAELFLAEILGIVGYPAEQKESKRGQWDVKAAGKTMEVKMASEDVSGNFQFNGVRYDTRYDFLVVIGIAPNDILFRFFKREDLMKMTLVAMARGTSGTYKLTRRRAQLLPIAEFPAEVRKFFNAPPVLSM